jgi:hypothetical protein
MTKVSPLESSVEHVCVGGARSIYNAGTLGRSGICDVGVIPMSAMPRFYILNLVCADLKLAMEYLRKALRGRLVTDKFSLNFLYEVRKPTSIYALRLDTIPTEDCRYCLLASQTFHASLLRTMRRTVTHEQIQHLGLRAKKTLHQLCYNISTL